MLVVKKLSMNDAVQVINRLLSPIEELKEWIPFLDKKDSESASLILKSYHKWLIKYDYIEPLNFNSSNQAIEFYFLEQVNLNQALPEVYYSLGEIYFLQQDWITAKYYWSLVSESSKLGDWARMNLAEMTILDNKFSNCENVQEAIDTFQSFAKSNDQIIKAESLWNLYTTYVNMNKVNTADRYLVDLIKYMPDYRMVNKKYVARLKALSDAGEALKFCCDEYLRTKDRYWASELIYFLKRINLKTADVSISFETFQNILRQLIKHFEYEEWCKIIGLIAEKVDLEEEQSIELLKEILSGLEKLSENNFYKVQELKEMSTYVEKIYLKYDGTYMTFETRKNIEIPLFYNCLLLGKYFKVVPFHYECSNRLQAWYTVSKEKNFTMANEIIELIKRPYINPQYLQRVDPIPNAYPWNEIIFHLEGIAERFDLRFYEKERLMWKGHYPFYSLFITGIFSTGKSTMINKILGERILKTKILPTTASLIWLKPGEQIRYEKIEFNSEIDFVEITEDLFHSSTTFGEKEEISIPYSQVTLPADFLEEHSLSLVDTPGFEDLNNGDSENLLNQMRLADGLIFLLDATRPLTSQESNYIQKINHVIQPEKINFVINKIDSVDKDELQEVYDYVLKALGKILNYTPRILMYSNKETDLRELTNFIKEEIPKDLFQLHFNHYGKIVGDQVSSWKNMLNKEIDNLQGSHQRICQTKDYISELNEELGAETNEVKSFIKNSLSNVKEKLETTIKNDLSNLIRSKKRSMATMFSDPDTIRANINERYKDVINNWIINDFVSLKKELFDTWVKDVERVLNNYFQLTKLQEKKREQINELRNDIQRPEFNIIKNRIIDSIKTFTSEIIKYDSNIIKTDDGFDKFIRGATSFFTKGVFTSEITEKDREKIENEIESMCLYRAETYFTSVNQSLSKLTNNIENTIKLLDRFNQSASEDLATLTTMEKAEYTALSKGIERLEKLEEELTFIDVKYENWRNQIQSGLIYNDQSLYVRPNNSLISLPFNNEISLKRNNKDKEIKIAIVGSYGTGKSTLINSILGRTLINFVHKNVVVDLYELNIKLLEFSCDFTSNNFGIDSELISDTDIILFTVDAGCISKHELELIEFVIGLKKSNRIIFVFSRKDKYDGYPDEFRELSIYHLNLLKKLVEEPIYTNVSAKEALRIRTGTESNLQRTRYPIYDSIDETGIIELENKLNHLLEEL